MVVGLGAKTTQLGEMAMECIHCHQQSNFHIHRESRQAIFVFIPIWSSEYFGTCGVCNSTFKLDTRKMKQLLKRLKTGQVVLPDGNIPNLKEYIDSKDYKSYMNNDGVVL